MKDELLQVMYQIFVLNVFLEAVNKAVGLDDSDEQRRSDVRLLGDIEGHPEEVQQAVSRWMREHDCPLSDVPIILAAEAYISQLAGELERSFYRDKAGIIVAEGNFRWLLERLTVDYHDETRLTDHLHVELFTQLPGMVRRARRVRPLILEREVPLGLDRRYHEAVKSYLSGHAIACCVLCRAVVETALKDALEQRTGQRVSLDHRTLGPLIDDAERLRLLPPEILKHCRSVKQSGDAAAHRDLPLTLDEAFQALVASQRVLQAAFAGRSPGARRRTD